MDRRRREFLTAAASFAAGAAMFEGTADAAASQPVTILNGRGAPKSHVGTIGDFYIDDRAHAIYGPKRSHGWGKRTSLIGPEGARGASGERGAAGAPGAQGPTGSEGPQGYSVLHGSGAPAASLGENNDFYIDTAATQLYGPKEGGVWGSPVSLTGGANITAIDGGAL